MILEPTPLPGLVLVRQERREDARGFFARTWCADDFAAAGHPFQPRQMSASFSERAFTLRGLHWQDAPHAETKLVRVTRGAAFDVAVDLRPGSPTRGRWHGVTLDAETGDAFLIPPGFAHGLLTLADRTEVLYAMDVPYEAAAARGARWDDPAFGIAWPAAPRVIAPKDETWPAWTAGQ
ncbi:dTDP-4-dehydrorhamnose 3,5-epimerase family protein [Alsobacter sp. R-9]